MEIIVGWLGLSFVVGLVGANRRIGFWSALFLSLFLSPLIGFVLTIMSKDLKDEAYKTQLLNTQQNQQYALQRLSEAKQNESSVRSIADEIEKLKNLRDQNLITEEEFQKLKDQLINSQQT